MSRKFLTPVLLPADPTLGLEAATKQYVDAAASGGIGTVNAFTFNSTTTAPPTGNQIRFNNATQASTTVIWISQTTFDGLDVSIGLSRISVGWNLYIQDYDDSTAWVMFNVTANGTDEGSYWSFPVGYVSGPGVPTQKVAVQTITPADHGLPPGGVDGDVLTKTSSSDFAAAWEAPTGGGGTPVGTKMTALTALTGAGAATTDIIEVVDISDTTMAASGTNKKMTLAELVTWLDANGITSTADLTTALASVAPIRKTIKADTTTAYAPILTDENQMITLSNASAITVTLPSNATQAFPISAEVDFLWLGAGQPTFAAGGGATVNATPGLKLRAQYSAATAKKISTNGWVVLGDLSA